MVIAEVGATADDDQIYRLTYDGSVADEHGFVAMGGSAEQISQGLTERYRDGLTLEEALRLAVELLGRDPVSGDQRSLTAAQLEVAVLDRGRPRRKFRRLTGAVLGQLLGDAVSSEPDATTHGPDERESSPPVALAGGSHEPAGPDADGTADDDPKGS